MREWITEDLGWKLFSVFLALVVWLTVHKVREEPTVPSAALAGVTLTYGNLPVQVVSPTIDVRAYRVQPGVVTVKVSGSPEVISVLQANQIHPVVNVAGAMVAGTQQPVEVSTPPGVTLVSVEPAEVVVQIPPKGDEKQ
jgi:YbbR domain-containing protein